MSQPFAIVGAGLSGLGVAAAMTRAGLPFEILEATDALGGNWSHGVYPSAHIISSKRTTEYSDFPMPDDYPDFPSAAQMLAYLHSYADEYGLGDRILYSSPVRRVEPRPDEHFDLVMANGERRRYRGVVIANGHHWDRRMPTYPGELDIPVIHSKDYKHPTQLEGLRVLTIGGGNSACDIAVEAARVGACSDISLRRGYWFMPKTIFGRPTVEFIRPWLPVWAQRLLIRTAVRLVFGRYEDYGLPKPDHRIFERHPTINSQLLYYIKHGRIRPRPDIERYDGRYVVFKDGHREAYDLIVSATGYNVSLPMLEGLVDWKDGFPQLARGMFSPQYKHLYVFGLGQPRYGAGPLVSAGSDLLCDLIQRQDALQHPVGRVLMSMGAGAHKTWLMDPMAVLRDIRRARRVAPLLPRLERRLLPKPPAAPITREA